MNFRIQDIASGSFFVLSPSGTLTADFNSTLFNAQSDLLGSYSYPLSMPLEPNRKLIRNGHYINTSAATRILDVMLYLGPLPFKMAKLYYTIEQLQINGELYFDLATITNQLKNVKLTELSVSGYSDQFNAESLSAFRDHMMDTIAAEPGVYPYVFFPYKNDGAYVEAAYVLTPLYRPLVVYNPDDKVTYTNGRIYRCIVTTSAGQNPVDWLDTQMSNTPQKWTDITVYPEILLPASDIINRWEIADDGTGSFAFDTDFPVAQTTTPFFYLTYVLMRICLFFGYDIESAWLQTDDAKRLVMFTNLPVTYAGQVPDMPFFMPDILVSDFLKELRSLFGLLIDFDPLRGVCYIESLKILETTDEIVDLKHLQTVSYRETGTQAQAFTIQQPPEGNDLAYDENDRKNPLILTIGDPLTAVQQTDIQLGSVSTKMITQQTPVPVFETSLYNPDMVITNQRIPWLKMPVAGEPPMNQVSTLDYADRQGFKLRFLFWHGMQPDDAGFNYPYGSSDNLDINGNPLRDFNLSLSATSYDYLALADYYHYRANSKPFEMVFLLDLATFLTLRNNRRVMVRDFNQSTVECLLSQLSVDFVMNKDTIAAKMTLFPKIQPDNTREILPPVPPVVTPPPFDNGSVYIRRADEDASNFTSPIPPHYVTHQKDLNLYFYNDAGATVPKDVTRLEVRLRTRQYRNEAVISDTVAKYTVTSTGDMFTLIDNAPQSLTEGPVTYSWVYELLTSAHYTLL